VPVSNICPKRAAGQPATRSLVAEVPALLPREGKMAPGVLRGRFWREFSRDVLGTDNCLSGTLTECDGER